LICGKGCFIVDQIFLLNKILKAHKNKEICFVGFFCLGE